jgi:hypothetical protein
VGSPYGGEAVSTLRLAVERAPENSMARAMLGFSLFRVADYHASAMPNATREEIVANGRPCCRARSGSYFARAIKALALQDLLGDARGAREQASEGLKYNANFIPAKGMLGIAEIHLGNLAEGTRLLQEAMEASPRMPGAPLGHGVEPKITDDPVIGTSSWIMARAFPRS